MMVDDFFMAALDSSSGMSVSTTSVSREILSFPMVTGNTTFFKDWTGPPFPNLNLAQEDLFLIETPSSKLSSKHFSQFCPHTVWLQPESKTGQFRFSPTPPDLIAVSILRLEQGNISFCRCFQLISLNRTVLNPVVFAFTQSTSCYVSFCILGVHNTFLIISPSFSWSVISFFILISSIPTSSSSGTAVVHRRGFVLCSW